MNTNPAFNSVQHTSLKAFLDAPDRSPGSMSYGAAVGFLFIVACAPEPIQPSVWIPVIIDPDNATETSLENMQSIMGGLISLYNEMCRQVQEADIKLPPDCRFRDAPLMNLETDAPMSQWASGFRTGYLWLEKMWADYTPEEIREDFGYHLTVLCFFSSRDMATAFHEEVKNDSLTLEKMAGNMKRIFPDAMVGVAKLGKSIQEVISARGDTTPKPAAHSQKVGRNDPCTCGSGKKFKKCCGGAQSLH